MTDEIDYAILHGISFKGAPKEQKEETFRTKARKRSYKSATRKTGAARHKQEIRQRVKKRNSQKH
ncbi:MAG: hypothetical protein IKG99_11450 [Bacteroidaceae bacterium]|nr:hypothetical protein [Bacteroidaceae bacterium]